MYMIKQSRYQRKLEKITIREELHIHAFLVRPPACPPKSEAPLEGPARWWWRDGVAPSQRRVGGEMGAASPAPHPLHSAPFPWLQLWKCLLRNACPMITESLSYILGKHVPKVGKHHEQTHLAAWCWAHLLKIWSAEVFSGHNFNNKAAFETHGLHCFVLSCFVLFF